MLTQQQQHSDEDTEEGSSGSSHFLSSQPTEDFIRLSSAQVQFVSAELEGSSLLHTVWTVDAATLPYSCDAVLVYELSEEHEALLDSYPVRCHSEDRPNKDLRLTVKLGDKHILWLSTCCAPRSIGRASFCRRPTMASDRRTATSS